MQASHLRGGGGENKLLQGCSSSIRLIWVSRVVPSLYFQKTRSLFQAHQSVALSLVLIVFLFCVLMILGVMLGHACRSVVHEETLEHKAALMSLLRTTIPPCGEFTAHCACFHSALTASRRPQSFTKISEKIDVFRPLRMGETPLIR